MIADPGMIRCETIARAIDLGINFFDSSDSYWGSRHEVLLGRALEARRGEVMVSSKFGNIAGSIVRSGEIKRGAKARITRDGVVVAENVEVAGLRRFKDDVTEVREGFECGINLGSFNDLQLGDLISTYEMREKPRA